MDNTNVMEKEVALNPDNVFEGFDGVTALIKLAHGLVQADILETKHEISILAAADKAIKALQVLVEIMPDDSEIDQMIEQAKVIEETIEDSPNVTRFPQ